MEFDEKRLGQFEMAIGDKHGDFVFIEPKEADNGLVPRLRISTVPSYEEFNIHPKDGKDWYKILVNGVPTRFQHVYAKSFTRKEFQHGIGGGRFYPKDRAGMHFYYSGTPTGTDIGVLNDTPQFRACQTRVNKLLIAYATDNPEWEDISFWLYEQNQPAWYLKKIAELEKDIKRLKEMSQDSIDKAAMLRANIGEWFD